VQGAHWSAAGWCGDGGAERAVRPTTPRRAGLGQALASALPLG